MTRFLTPAGEVVGWRDRGVIRATGIRYARAGRFERPVPEPAAASPIDATHWSPACPQPTVPYLDRMLGGPLGLPMSEDCLRLSVTLPGDGKATDARPVMVWIHGGSYKVGAGDAPMFDVRPLVEEQGVIAVALTYRLGLFGFLGGFGDRAANLGLLDLQEGLRWVQKNIHAFGGDPGNVTLFGESAGGDAIAHLLISEGSEGLFRRAIIQSAPLGISRGRKKMSAAMGAEAARLSAGASVDELIAHSTHVATSVKGFGLAAGMPFGTQYGHAPLPEESALEAAWAKAAPRVDVLVGYAAEEASFFLPELPRLRRLFGLPAVGGLARRAAVSALTWKVYGAAAKWLAKLHAKAGGRAYLYRIDWGSKTNGFGATHTIDMPLLFGDEATWKKAVLVEGIGWAEIERNAKNVRALWARFARTGALPAEGTIEPGVLSYRRV